MMKYFLLAFLLLFAMFVQATFLVMPLVLGMLLFFVAWGQEEAIIIFAFILGILSDILMFHPVGVSSLFFIGALGLVLLYKRKFEIYNPVFVGISVFVFSLLYGVLFIHIASFFNACLLAIILATVFWAVSIRIGRPQAHWNTYSSK